MQNLHQIHSQVFESLEKAIFTLESQHEQLVEQAYTIVEKLPAVSDGFHALKNIQLDLIHKSYRGSRDLSEMWRQAGEQLLSLSSF